MNKIDWQLTEVNSAPAKSLPDKPLSEVKSLTFSARMSAKDFEQLKKDYEPDMELTEQDFKLLQQCKPDGESGRNLDCDKAQKLVIGGFLKERKIPKGTTGYSLFTLSQTGRLALSHNQGEDE